MQVLCGLILLLPLAGCVLNGLVGPRAGRKFVNLAGTLSILASFIVACVMFGHVIAADAAHKAITVHMWQWLDLGTGANLSAGVDFTLDPLSALMVMVITGVGFLIHVYSVGYMKHDDGVARFFAYMNFFIFSMLLLVLAADLVILIVGWALVALSSYLLIGFWYQRPSAVLAARKAFITQVIGDVALVVAAFMIAGKVNSLSLPTIFGGVGAFDKGGAYVTGICILLAIGAFAKSAQFPLHTWLPDAMEGPTPVSALIHAATMVTAGVYLIARFHPLFDIAPTAQLIVACVGMGTALMAAITALSQIDIKRVIAYSTMSQIGLMIFAVGMGAYSVGMFHFTTHAIFKALLFLAAGNVIHALGDEQDIRLMGGLAGKMKWTAAIFAAGSVSLAGFPLVSGWFSKEALLGFGANGGGLLLALYFVGVAVNILTGLYAFRLYFTVFQGKPQTARVFAAKEAPMVMLAPVAVLGVGALFFGWIEWPFPGLWHLMSDFLSPVFHTAASGPLAQEPGWTVASLALVVGTLASLIGIGGAFRLWYQHRPDAAVVADRLPRLVSLLSLHKFYFDEMYDALLVRPLCALARVMRKTVEPGGMDRWVRGTSGSVSEMGFIARDTETGLIRDYAVYMVAAAVLGVVASALLWFVR